MSQEISVKKTFMPDPTTFEEAWRMAQVMADSDLVPKDFKGKPANCLIAMQWGADIGIPGIQAIQNIAVINGRPSIWGDAAKALVIGRSDCEDIKEFFEGEGDKLTAVCIATRKGKSPVTSKFSLADAKAAGLLGKQGPWSQYRNRMMQMRARSFALRDAFPDALKGLSIAEESQDIHIEKEINPIAAASEKTEAVLSKLNKQAPIEHEPIGAEPETTLDEVMAAIAMANSKETLAGAKALMTRLTGDDRKTAEAYRAHVDELKRQLHEAKQAQELENDYTSLAKHIDSCTTPAELNDIIETMREEAYKILAPKIKAKGEQLEQDTVDVE